jgi:hypothetical protein
VNSTALLDQVPDRTDFVSVTCGPQATCALTSNGTVICWDSITQTYYRNPPSDAMVVVTLGGGGFAEHDHVCGIRLDGTILCWTHDILSNYCPGCHSTTDTLNYTAMCTGTYQTCGFTTDGATVCWSDTPGFM